MKFTRTNILALLIVLASFVVGIYYYPQLPQTVASHWNSQGEVNGHMSKFWGTFLMPIIGLAMYVLFLIIPAIDPKRKNIHSFRNHFDNFILIIIAFLFYVDLMSIYWNLGHHLDFNRLLSPALAILLYFAAILVENAQPNYFIGIRTPWTLANEDVWAKTHKLGAKLFKISAILALVGIFIPKFAVWFVIGPMIASTIYAFVYSYLEFEKTLKK